ncbi:MULTISPECIES: Gp49 family protein [Pseudomonas syringae group]|uniref:Gp49 family protein n=1 Tax=Pseudomonas syringae group TaxID=136849 RepID=UPI000F041EDC|nr:MULTISPECIES: Gp49 family protein [Pseudomonas syringae group]RXU11598.1 hypothetical protein B1F68_00730 [Pseudomonas syringae]RXU11619.1 hypothetical protein B1F68_00845 [Pseudomonas syringae]
MNNSSTLEAQIVGLGLTAPRILPEQIDALVDSLSIHTYVIPGTTTTVAAAIDSLGFVVALGQASAVSAANFNEAIGRNHATSKAKAAAREEFWKLEGYRLKRNLHEAAKVGLISELSVLVSDDPSLSADLCLSADVALGHCLVQASAAQPVRGAR